jgi:hypothetical protein
MSGTIIPVDIHKNLEDCSLLDIYKKVAENLNEETGEDFTRYNIKLLSLNSENSENSENEDPIKCLYRDIMESSMIGCYIDEVIVYIDSDDNNIYYVNNVQYKWINFIIVMKNRSITISCYECDGNFFTDNDIFNIEMNNIRLIDHSKIYNNIQELFLSSQHFWSITSSYENIFSLSQNAYDDYKSGIVKEYEDDMKWESCKKL